MFALNKLLSSMLLLLLVSCLLGSVSAEQGRKLTATPLNCRALHDRCSSCAMATKPGTKTSYVKCTQCDASPAGYTPYTNLDVTPIKSTCGEHAGRLL
jgi:ribosomal protein L37AE/L43A